MCVMLCVPLPPPPHCLSLSILTDVPLRKAARSAPARRTSSCWCCTGGASWTRARGTRPARWPTSTPSAPCWRRSRAPTSPQPWATSSSSSSPVPPSALRLSHSSPSESLSACLDWLGLVGGRSGGATPATWVRGGQVGACLGLSGVSGPDQPRASPVGSGQLESKVINTCAPNPPLPGAGWRSDPLPVLNRPWSRWPRQGS